ncbi:DUF302 domain-containing protein [Winogradskyella ursingii]|uniref:DUF302 domain-containing protein n=1 Tax=Winogradskyella ursingii TaxID=2686079 RepID=UPI0015C8A9E4|nr:DUF302 domain-containing protein [Winogradskyella ursingii]
MKKSLVNFVTITLAFFLLNACNNSDNSEKQSENKKPQTEGIGFAVTNETALSVYNAVISKLNANSNISIIAEVNHSANAQNADLELNFTRTVYFGNPALGTPIMNENMQAGLDLPQRITVYTDEDDDTIVCYNSVEYLADRHNLETAPTLNTVASALSNIVNSATDEEVTLNNANFDVSGIISITSNNDFETTYNNIISTLNTNENISIFAELDHQANAQSVNMDLLPSKLIIFGNPVLGTPLMQASRTMALDLPQKILVYQNNEGEVHIIYNEPFYLAGRHDINSEDEALSNISQALQNIANSGSM